MICKICGGLPVPISQAEGADHSPLRVEGRYQQNRVGVGRHYNQACPMEIVR